MAGYDYKSLTMEVRTQIGSVGARTGRFMSCIGQEKRVVGVLSGVVVGVVIIILVVSMVTIRDNTERGEDLKSAYIRGIMNITRIFIGPSEVRATSGQHLGGTILGN
jgi:hypothetical protein